MQMSLFDGTKNFIISKPVRLISLFSGYDSQALALKYLSINFEHYKTCEWAVKSIQALKDLHFKDDITDYSKNLTQDEIIDYLTSKGISANYNEPMTREQIKRLGEQKQRQIYNNIKASHNLVNIQQAKASDLEIADVDKYCYLMTYSFPCQDLSKAGLGKGMEKGGGTRSGMLWEVERILDECENLPQILLMENVPDVIGSKNIIHFAKWLEKLESLGYKCYWRVLNAKDYGIPQNRERCFMISLLGDYYYEFPQPIKLEHRLKDLLEDSVDEKYYLSDKAIQGGLNTNFKSSKLENKIPKNGICPTICARDYKDPKCILEPKCIGGIGDKNSNNGTQWHQQDRIYDNNIAISVTTGFNPYYVSKEKNLKTKLCNELIASGKVKENDVIRHNFTTSKNGDCIQSNNEVPTLDTRCDCLGVVVNTKNKRQQELANKIDTKIDGQYLDFYNQTTNNEISGTITTRVNASNSSAVYNNYRIRKLTPKECFRLMGVKDEDFDKVAQNQSNASLYHLAGDSIVVNVLMAIFKSLLKE